MDVTRHPDPQAGYLDCKGESGCVYNGSVVLGGDRFGILLLGRRAPKGRLQ